MRSPAYLHGLRDGREAEKRVGGCLRERALRVPKVTGRRTRTVIGTCDIPERQTGEGALPTPEPKTAAAKRLTGASARVAG
jgi:hypothetical protein